MDSPISISSGTDFDDDSIFGDYGFDVLNNPLPGNAYGGNAVGNAAYRPPTKRQRVRGPDLTTINDAPNALLASLGPNSWQPTQDPRRAAQPADATDPLLVQLLEIFPDISHTYVSELIARHKAALVQRGNLQEADSVQLALSRDAIYEEILTQKSYPKQAAEASKRKREDADSKEPNWQTDTLHQSEPTAYSRAAAEMLAQEFPLIPMNHVRKVLGEKKRAYHAFLALHADDNLDQNQRPYANLKKSRISPAQKFTRDIRDIVTIEIVAARRETRNLEAAVRKKKEEEDAEKANEEEYTRTGNLVECGCCYTDAPANRAIPCEGNELHFFCYACIRKSAETQIGLMKYTLQCFDVSGCQASFARPHLKEVLGASMMSKLDSLQQADEIRMAGLDGLEDCPFCSFKAVLAPVEEDREFRCANPACKVVSCRLCKEKTHIPKTCEEARKDKGLSERHEVEEAMSKALIRNCPKCQVKIVKEDGCNKMICPQCHTSMCYVCKKDITKEAYGHFGRGCPQSDNMGRRDQLDVQQAERAAINKALLENPDLTEEQLRIHHPNKTKAQPIPTRQPAHHHIHQFYGGPPLMHAAPFANPAQLTNAQMTAEAQGAHMRAAMLARHQGIAPAPMQYPFYPAAAFPQAPVRAEPPRPNRAPVAQGYTQWEQPNFFPGPRMNAPERVQQPGAYFAGERFDLPTLDPRVRPRLDRIYEFGDDDDIY
ncbi:hypothetical protein BJX68DRAFT_264427 [Aspergillus pseudodeflectus]|uniref:RING-type domain-containing protein n=1 Tax=Aspergillus pseudodeflectus TaxID=176178 RepID=A0ABR4KR55_9EURO